MIPMKNMGIDLKSLTGMGSDNVKLSEMLAASLSSQQYMSTFTYEDTKLGYEYLKNLIGDSAFTKKNGRQHYSLFP